LPLALAERTVGKYAHRTQIRGVIDARGGRAPTPQKKDRECPNNPRAQAAFFRVTGDTAKSWRLAVGSLDSLRQQQAATLAYFDCVLGLRFPRRTARISRAGHEALGCRKGCAYRGGMKVQRVNRDAKRSSSAAERSAAAARRG